MIYFDEVFARQVEAHGQPGDVLVVISSSGQSANLVNAIRTARRREMFCIGLLGKEGGAARELADVNIIVPSNETSRIQESAIARSPRAQSLDRTANHGGRPENHPDTRKNGP